MLINFVDATNDANHYTKPSPSNRVGYQFEKVNRLFKNIKPVMKILSNSC